MSADGGRAAAAAAVRAGGAGEAAARRPSASSRLLGKVNPLALEEFAALEERHKFLTEQLEDLKSSKRDLLDIVREVDERVEKVFTEAYHDTARAVRARLRSGSSPAARAGSCSPTPTTC